MIFVPVSCEHADNFDLHTGLTWARSHVNGALFCTLSFATSFSGIFFLTSSIVFAPDFIAGRVIGGTLGKGFIVVAYDAIIVWSTELFPTIIR